MSIELYIVRHGQTALNFEDRYLGSFDPPLNALGLEQAKSIANALTGKSDVIVSSPLLRARQTAEILANAWRTNYTMVSEFSERNVGVYEGLTRDEAKSTFPELWRQDITRQWEAGPPGGESIEAVFKRVAIGLQLLSSSFEGKRVTLVAHGFVAKTVRALIDGGTREEFFAYALKNGEFARYVLSHDSRLDTGAWGAGQPSRHEAPFVFLCCTPRNCLCCQPRCGRQGSQCMQRVPASLAVQPTRCIDGGLSMRLGPQECRHHDQEPVPSSSRMQFAMGNTRWLPSSQSVE